MKFELSSRLVHIIVEFLPKQVALKRYRIAGSRRSGDLKRDLFRRTVEALKTGNDDLPPARP